MMILVAVLVIALVVAIGIGAWMYQRQRRTTALREQFGPEYDRALNTSGDQHRAEQELAARKERVEALDIRPLTARDREHFSAAWTQTQSHFVDDPARAIEEADGLIREVMSARGYPMGGFEARAADLSVEHPEVVSNYRAAHRIAVASGRGEATTEQLRQAMVHYRALFTDLLETREVGADGSGRRELREAQR